MLPFERGVPRCKQCGFELESGADTCPQCQFSPKQKGLRVSLALLMVVVVSISIMMFVPAIGPLLIRLAALAFILSLLVFLVSFLATPSRFGSLFLRL